MPFTWNPISAQFDVTRTGGGGASFHDPVGVATTSNLTATYDNGSSGVGATLTNSGALAALTIDGVSPVAGSRVLVKDQTNAWENGIYDVTVAGDGSTPWVLTRSTDYDEPPDIEIGDLVPITSGTVNTGTIWEQISDVNVIGTDNINFVRFTLDIEGQSGAYVEEILGIVYINAPKYVGDINTSGTSLANTGEFITGSCTRTLPADADLVDGDLLEFVVVSGTLTIQLNTGQDLQVGDTTSSTAGTAQNTANGDAISLRYQKSATKWWAVSPPQGIWSFA